MDTADSKVNLGLLEVPGEDAAIPRALEHLERLIGEWAEQARWVKPADAPQESVAAPKVEIVGAAGAASSAPTIKRPVILPPRKKATEEAVAGVARPIERKPEPPPAPAEPEPPPSKAVSTAEEDEALLQSLDPATAKAIRIKRRLCNNTKSVRELLDEG